MICSRFGVRTGRARHLPVEELDPSLDRFVRVDAQPVQGGHPGGGEGEAREEIERVGHEEGEHRVPDEHRVDEVPPLAQAGVRAIKTAGSNNDVVRVRSAGKPFAGQLCDPVNVQRIRWVTLDIGAWFFSVKDIVRADLNHPGANRAAFFGNISGAQRVDLKRGEVVVLTLVDVGECGGVYHPFGPHPIERRVNVPAIADIRAGVREQRQVVRRKFSRKIQTQLAVGAKNANRLGVFFHSSVFFLTFRRRFESARKRSGTESELHPPRRRTAWSASDAVTRTGGKRSTCFQV